LTAAATGVENGRVPRTTLLVLAAAAALAAADAPAGAAPPTTAAPISLPFEKLTLPNGLVVILSEDHRAPVVGVDIRFGVGRRDDPAGKRGLSALLREVYARAPSRRIPEADREALFVKQGLSGWTVESYVSLDATWVRATAPSRALPLLLWLESDRMAFASEAVDEAVVRTARKMAEEAAEPSLFGTVRDAAYRATFGDAHPYGRVAHGPIAIDAVHAPEVRAALRASFVPGNAVLSLSGDFSPPRARELIARYFGSIASPPQKARSAAPPAAALTGERRVRVEADVEAPLVLVAWPTALYFTDDDARLDVIAWVLGGRLKASLVDRGVATRFGTHQSSGALGSVFSAHVELARGHTTGEALAALDQALAALSSGPAEREVRRPALLRMTRDLMSYDAPLGRASSLAELQTVVGDPGLLGRRATTYGDTTGATLARTVATALPRDRRVVVEVVPTKGAPPSGRVIGEKP
jgi:zinc protease